VNREDPQAFVNALLPKLRSARVVYFPIRHHSPACAAHLQRWIQKNKPASVLIEAPASFTSLIPLLLDPATVCPVALFTSFTDKKGRLGEVGPLGPPRSSAFYPFCDYSPELVALREGQSVGAELKFIDLEYPEMLLTRKPSEEMPPQAIRVESLVSDNQLSHSSYVRQLARKLGCRDANEAWEHLFETQWDSPDTDSFIDRVATYCAMSRHSYSDAQLAADDTHPREACMASHITDEIKRLDAEKKKGLILVVTGGFHTVVLPDLVTSKTARPKRIEVGEDENGVWLTRYSFDQLDALSGYSAGMPHPGFYHRLWKASVSSSRPEESRANCTAEIIVEVSRLTRFKGFHPHVTTPDATAAVRMSRELARFRGHPSPSRSDVLDGMQSCFIKGETKTDGVLLMRLVNEIFAGNLVGSVPSAAGVPPIVEDFHRESRRLKLPVDVVERKELSLDLYRDVRHRQVSRFFHRLALLGSTFANYVNGPDFVHGTGLDRMIETWSVCWSPASESALVEAAIYGTSIEEAATNKLREAVAKLEAEGVARDTAAAVQFLVMACRLGLHRQADELVQLVKFFASDDPSFVSLVSGMTQLELLSRSREPLEAGHLQTLPELVEATYQRGCYLVGDLVNCPDELVDPVISALQSLQETLSARDDLDVELLRAPLKRILSIPADKGQASIIGACSGLLFNQGQISEADLITLATGFLGASMVEPRRSAGFLRGLLATSREIAWQVKGIIEALNTRFGGWDEADFLAVLPELRLAFSDLTPREVAQVAEAVATFNDGKALAGLVRSDLTEGDAILAASISKRVRESLQADGLWEAS
jgi:hypothetical protein